MNIEINSLFDRQHAASRASPPASAIQRRQHLGQLETMLRTHAAQFIEAIHADFHGRASTETKLLELFPALSAIAHAKRHLARWMKPERRPVEWPFMPGRARVHYQPLGVVGVISPWNYPLLLSVSPLADALAAGNRVMLKPSELTPMFSSLLQRCIADTFSPDRVCVITGDADTAREFARLPFDHLLFTGSTAIGRDVMRAAAEHLTPVTLELGGKSPAIIAEDYPLAAAARSIAFGKLLNAGQTCIAPDYVLIPEARVDEFGQALLAVSEANYPTLEDNCDYSAIIHPRHIERLKHAVDEVREAGAKILVHRDAAACAGKFPPTVILNPPPDSILMREEIFGPILPVLGYRTLDETVDFVNARPRPLALYLFSHQAAVKSKVLANTHSGGVTLNGTLMHIAQNALPFGGIGPSGMGAYHGRDGFRRLSHARAVFTAPRFNTFEHLGPPWGRLSQFVSRFLTRVG